MTLPSLDLCGSVRFRRFRDSRLWLGSVVLLSLLVCMMVTWLHVQQKAALNQSLANLDYMRQARIDLAKGFLHVSLADMPESPFGQTEGIALLRQSITSLNHSVHDLKNADPQIVHEFEQSVAAFEESLARWQGGGRGRADSAIHLRIAFHQLERQADAVDLAISRHLTRLSHRLDLHFSAALGGAVVLLVVICGVVFCASRKKDELEVATLRSEYRFSQAMEAVSEGLWDRDVETDRLYFSPAFWSMLGYDPEAMEGTSEAWAALLHPDDRERALALNQACVDGRQDDFETEFRLKTRDGSWKWILSRGRVVSRDDRGRALRIMGTHVDITTRKRYEERLTHMATHDELTGLANRALLLDRLERALLTASSSGGLVAVLLLDLDRFKVINDSIGHAFGDKVLFSIARRLESLVKKGDTIARLGGDEFVLLLTEMARPEEVSQLAAEVLENLTAPFTIDGREVILTASIGISLSPGDSLDGPTLIRDADIAMYRAKKNDRNTYAFYSKEMNQQITRALEMESALRQALDRHEFLLHYQPKVDLASGRIVGCEALVRWHHPERGLVSPADFIPLAEETGLIIPLGLWVLMEACRQARVWQQQGFDRFSVAVNLSARQFHRGDLEKVLEEVLRDIQLPPDLLELELTESMVMQAPETAKRTMLALKDLGVSLSLDDFGTGYSSLNYLRRFPVDCLKIDRSFIRDVVTDPAGASMVASIIDIAHNLGLSTVAEGVETEEQLAFLRGCGCDVLQGYLFSPPLPASQFAALLQEGRRLVAV